MCFVCDHRQRGYCNVGKGHEPKEFWKWIWRASIDDIIWGRGDNLVCFCNWIGWMEETLRIWGRWWLQNYLHCNSVFADSETQWKSNSSFKYISHLQVCYHPSISSNKYLLITHSVPGTILGAIGTTVCKITLSQPSWKLCSDKSCAKVHCIYLEDRRCMMIRAGEL